MSTADYPGAIWMPAHPSNYRSGRTVTAPTQLVCHCTDGHGIAQDVGEMWSKPVIGNDGKPRPSSAHFCVGQDGTVIQAVRISDTAYHAHTANSTSIGIEHCARTPRELGPNDSGLPPSDALYVATAKLQAWLCVTLDIQPSRVTILGHAEADPHTTHSLCPVGCGFDWPRVMQMIAAEYQNLVPASMG